MRLRPLWLYLRSRRVPAAFLTTVVAVTGMAWLGSATGHPPRLGLVAVLAAATLIGPGLAGNDIDLDRTSSWRWPVWRTVHIGAACGAVTGLAAAPAVAGESIAPAGQMVRDAVGLVGLVALAAAVLGAQHAWIPPVTWCLLSLTVLPRLWPPGQASTPEQVVTWMVQPVGTPEATATALTLGVVGTLTYAVRGPHR